MFPLTVQGKDVTFAVVSITADSVEKKGHRRLVYTLPPPPNNSLDRKTLKRTLKNW